MFQDKNKTLDKLNIKEINSLISNSRSGGYMKALMKNLKNDRVVAPDRIKIFYKENLEGEIISWFLIDRANEICPTLSWPELSVMLYTGHRYRKLGLMKELVVLAKSELENDILKVYADTWELDYIFIKKITDPLNLTIQSHITSYDLK